MILQALHRLAEDEELLTDPDFEWKPVAWLLRVGADGKLLAIEGTREPRPESAGRTARPVAKQFLVPREPGRTSGDRAFFLFDKAEYVLGIDPDGKRKPAKLAKRAALFRDRVRECAEATGDEAAKAVLRCLEAIDAGEQVIDLPDDVAPNDLFAFVYAPQGDRLVTDRPAVRELWRQWRGAASEGAQQQRCLVSGELCVPVDKHPAIKRVPGGTSSGVALVSFNTNAFESYGWRRNENAAMSREAAEACSAALSRLVHPAYPDPNHPGQALPRQNVRLGADTVACYWASGKAAQRFVSCFGGLLEANPEQVEALYQSIWSGRAPAIEDPSAFYALTLSGAQGRAIVRDWFESTVAKVARNLARHFADLTIVRNTPKPKGRDLPPQLPLRALLDSLAPLGRSQEVPPHLASRLIRAALQATPYPLSILQRAIQRMRAEIGQDGWAAAQRCDARAALIKAVLNRRKRFLPNITSQYKEVTTDMDPSNTTPGYLLGRLMAVIERMQQVALGDVGATVVDRYFSSASATPAVAFPRLLKNLRHHASRAKDDEKTRGTAGWLEGQVDQILVRLHSFPASLDLEQQGLFILGFHHQRHWLWMSKADREKWEAAHPTPEEEPTAQ